MKKVRKLISGMLSATLFLLCTACGSGDNVTKNQSGDVKLYSSAAKNSITALNSTTFDESQYNIKVTTFNVGNWYWGTYKGIPDSIEGSTNFNRAQKIESWQTAKGNMDSDIIGMQEMYTSMYNDPDTGKEVSPLDYFSDIYNAKLASAPIRWLDLTMYNGFLSKYEAEDFSYGYISDADGNTCNRLYVKAYVTIGDVRIAIFCVHTSPNELDQNGIRIDQINEIRELCSAEDYFICFGDFNTPNSDDFQTLRDAGFNLANHGDFGSINTYRYAEGNRIEAIDNIVTSSNIDITAVERSEQIMGESDHYPLTAYLTIHPDLKADVNRNVVGTDGYVEGYYHP